MNATHQSCSTAAKSAAHPSFETFARIIDRRRTLSQADKAYLTWVAWTHYCSRSRFDGANFASLMLG